MKTVATITRDAIVPSAAAGEIDDQLEAELRSLIRGSGEAQDEAKVKMTLRLRPPVARAIKLWTQMTDDTLGGLLEDLFTAMLTTRLGEAVSDSEAVAGR